VPLNVSELERRLSQLQSEMERVGQRMEPSVPLERLAGMEDQYVEYLKRWTHTVERHTHAVTQLEDYIAKWKDVGSRLQEDSSQRLNELEGLIEREWNALRSIHEAPARELRDEAAKLAAISIAAAGAAQHGFDRAERRIASLEGEFHLALNELTRELRLAVAEIRALHDRPAKHLPGETPWPLDDVTRLHRELRDSAAGTVEGRSPFRPPDLAAVWSSRHLPLRTLPTAAVGDEHPNVSQLSDQAPGTPTNVAGAQKSADGSWRLAVGICMTVVLVAAALGWRMQRQVQIGAERLQKVELDSAQRVELAEQNTVAVREEAARDIAAAREMATRAQRIGNVLAAPDLVRFNLFAANAPSASGQVLWSRSNGLVFSGAGIAQALPNRRHQLWLLTRATPVAAGTLTVAPDGTVTTVLPPPSVTRAVIGVMVTVEEGLQSDSPSSDIALTSVRPVL
jgi:hypothetical protein